MNYFIIEKIVSFMFQPDIPTGILFHCVYDKDQESKVSIVCLSSVSFFRDVEETAT